MTDLNDTMRLLEMVCARLCHDIAGLTGTVGNAIEMALEERDNPDGVLAFAGSAGKALTQRLRLLRTAWGPDTGPVSIVALRQLIGGFLDVRRVVLDTAALPRNCTFAPDTGRVVLNLVLLAADCLPKGGTISMVGKPSDLLVLIDESGSGWPAYVIDCLNHDTRAIAGSASAQTVQLPMTVLLARSRGLRLSPVLGPAGIVALRLGGA